MYLRQSAVDVHEAVLELLLRAIMLVGGDVRVVPGYVPAAMCVPRHQHVRLQCPAQLCMERVHEPVREHMQELRHPGCMPSRPELCVGHDKVQLRRELPARVHGPAPAVPGGSSVHVQRSDGFMLPDVQPADVEGLLPGASSDVLLRPRLHDVHDAVPIPVRECHVVQR